MGSNKQESFMISRLIKPEDLELGEVACLFNSILTIVKNLKCVKHFPKTEIEDLFGYDSKDGIWNEKYKFQRLNTRLKEKKCLCKLYHQGFRGKKDLFQQLESLDLPVPVFFDICILDEIKPKIKETTGIIFSDGLDTSLINDTFHILLLVGYGNYGNDLYFIDPNYMLLDYDEEDLKSLSKIIIINTEKFWQYVAKPKQYVQIKCTKKELPKVKNGLNKYIK